MDYLLHKANGTDTAELNKQVGGFSAISSVLVKLNHNKVGEMELKLSSPAYTIAIGDWVEAKGKRFYCLNNWKEYIPGEFSLTLLTVEGFGLTSNFYHCTEGFDVVYSWTRDNNKVDTGSLKTFGEFFCYNVNYQQNTRLFKLGSYPEGSDADYRVLSFTNENALSCLYEICTAYGVRYEFVLNEDEDSLYILNFYAEDVVYPETFSYEKQGGLYDLSVSSADGQVYTEFVVLGSDENLPADYPYSELRLSDDYPLSMIKYPNKYTTWGRSVKELKLDVKPSRVGIVTSEVAGDLNSFIDSDLIGATWSPVGGTIHVVEGPLLGFEFNVSGFNAITGKVNIEQNTEGATTLPEAEYYKFTEGTKYTITGIPLPASYLTTAQANLLTESEPHRLYWSEPRYDARINVKPKFLETNGEIEAGMLLPVIHAAIGLNRNFRVQSITYDPRCEQYYDVVEIAVSDFRQESIADSQHRAIRTTIHRLEDTKKVTTSIKTAINNLDTYVDGAFADGLVSQAEANAIEKYINTVNSTKSDIDAQFTALYANSYLSGDPKTNLNAAKGAIDTATTNLLSSINTAIADGAASAAEKLDVDSKFTAFNSALSTYQTRVEEANALIQTAAIDAAVVKATYWSVKASAPVIYKDAINAATAGSHTSVTVSGELRSGTTATAGGFITVTPNSGTEAGTASASPVTIAPSNGDGKTSYTVRLYDTAAKTTLLDTMTIPVVFKGASGVNAINVVLSNEADVLPASTDGTVSDYSGSGTEIRVFEGATELSYGTSNGQYQVSAVGSGITVGTPSTSGNRRVYGVASNMTSDNATITFTISGKTASGTSFSLTKVQAFAKSRTGQKGADGEPGPIGKRVVSGLVYYQLASSTAPGVPTATAYNFTNNAFTGLCTNWALTPPVFEAGNANKFWYVGFYVQETASGGGTGTPTFSTVKQAISFSGLVTFTAENTVSDGTKTLSFGENGTTEINGGKITTGKVSAERIEVEDLIVKCLLTDVDDQGFIFDIRTINIDNDQVSQFRLYDPDSSVKAKIEMQGSGSEVYMNIENEEIGTSTDKDGFHVNDIDEYGNRTERVKLAKGEMFLSNENTGKEMLIGTDKIVFNQMVGDETKEVAAISVDTIPRMIFASDWSGMTESQKKAIPLAYIYDINNAITNIYRYGGYAIPGTNVTLYASSSVTSTDSRWTDMNNAYGDTPSTFAYCNKYNEEQRLYLAFDVSTLPSNAIITQFTIEAKVRGALGWLTTNKIWGGVLWDGSEQWDWDIANNGTAQLRYTSRAGQFTKAQMTNMRAIFRSDLNGNAAVGREVRVYYAKLTLTYVTQ